MVNKSADHWNEVKMLKTLHWNQLPAWFHLSFEHVDVISMVDKSTDRRYFFYTQP